MIQATKLMKLKNVQRKKIKKIKTFKNEKPIFKDLSYLKMKWTNLKKKN